MGYHPRCRWRRRLAGGARSRILRRCLAAALIMEGSFGAWLFLADRLSGITVIRLEKDETVEWFVPEEEEREGRYEVFGIQFRLEDGEVRIYHSREEIKSH